MSFYGKEEKPMHTKKLIAALSAAAFTLSTAAGASSVITFAEEVKQEKTTPEETEAPAPVETVTSVTADMEGFEEEVADTGVNTEIVEEEKSEEEIQTVIFKGNRNAGAAEKRIRLAELSSLPVSPTTCIDVGNLGSTGEVTPLTDFPYTQVSVSSSEQALWDLFKSMGFTDAGAAGAMGNLAMESGLNPSSRSSNFDPAEGRGGGGLAGWMCAGRFRGLMTMAEANGESWQSLSIQMSYLKYELENTRKNVGQQMKTETDVDMAADYFCVYFEGCVGRSGSPQIDGISEVNGKWYQGLNKRKALARTYYERYAGH